MLTHVLTISSMSLGEYLGSTTKLLWNTNATIEVSVDGFSFTFTYFIRLHNSLQISSLITVFLCDNVALTILSLISAFHVTDKCLPSTSNDRHFHLKHTCHHLHSKIAEAWSYNPTCLDFQHIIFPFVLFSADSFLLPPFQTTRSVKTFQQLPKIQVFVPNLKRCYYSHIRWLMATSNFWWQ